MGWMNNKMLLESSIRGLGIVVRGSCIVVGRS